MKRFLTAIATCLTQQINIALPRAEEIYSILPWDVTEVFVNFAIFAILIHQACFEMTNARFRLYRLMYQALPAPIWVSLGLFICVMQLLSVLLILPLLRRRLIQGAGVYLAVVGGLMLLANPTNLVSWLVLLFALMAAGAARRLRIELRKGSRTNARPDK